MTETLPPNTIADRIIATSRSVPEAIEMAKSLDPTLADALTPKALLASKTVWGTLAALILAWIVRHYTLGWDRDTIELVSGLGVLGVTVALRLITAGRITSMLPPAPVEPPVTTEGTKP